MKAKVYIGAKKYAVYIGRKIVEKTMNFFSFPARFFATKDGNLKDYKMYGKTVQSNLPEGYTQLEYLEGTGSQYIVTDFFFDNVATDTLSCDFMRTTTGAGSLLYGFRDAYKVNGYGFQFNDTGRTYRQYGDSDTGLGSTYVFNLNTRYTATQTGYTYVIGGRTSAVVASDPVQNYPLTVFAIRNSDQPPATITPMRLYKLNVVNASGNTILNLVPVRRNDGVLGLYDTVAKKFYTNAGTGEFIAGNVIGLPEGYTQLEYIVADGNAYVDTGFKANTTTTRFVGAFRLTDVSVSQGFFGSRNGKTAESSSCLVLFATSGSYVRGDWVSGSAGLSVPVTENTIITVDVTRGYGVINGTTITSTSSASVDQINNFYVGHFRNGDGTMFGSGIIGHIFPCQLISNDVVIRNLVPAKRNSDEKIGMYDVENNVFYPSAGTSEFTAGPVFSLNPTPANPIAIESVGERTKNIFDKNNALLGYGIGATGVIAPTTQYNCSNYVEVKPNTTYIRLNNTNPVGNYYHLYDKDKQWIERRSATSTGLMITSANTKYIAVAITLDININTYQIVEGDTATEYEPYGYKIPVNVTSKNLFNPTSSRNAYLQSPDVGRGVAWRTSTATTTYIDCNRVEAGKTYTISCMASQLAAASARAGAIVGDDNLIKQVLRTPEWIVGKNEYSFVAADDGWLYVAVDINSTDISVRELNETTNIYLSEPLRRLGDLTDYIDFDNQKVVRQVGGLTFNGSESWAYWNTSAGKLFRTVADSKFASGTKYDLGAICDKYTTVEQSARTNNTMTGIDRNVDLINNNFSDVNSWKAELTISNVTVVYPLATPTEESITLPAIALQQGNLSMDVETKIKPSQLTITGDIDDVR